MNRKFEKLTDNVYPTPDGKSVVIIDQTKLPNEVVELTLSTAEEMYDAIKTLAVRGAPAIGICAGNSIYCLAQQIEAAGGIDYDMPYELAYSGLDDTLLRKYINDNEHVWRGHADELKYGIVGSTIGTHAGPGAVAVAFFSV